MASNIGGAATLIGDPPNILIGSAANIDFVTFFVNMIVPVTISLILFIPLSYFVFRNDLRTEQGSRPRVAELEGMITDPPLLRKSLIVIAGVLLGFIFHGTLHLEPATIAMFGATILMLWTRKESHEVFHHVEWNTLMFFVGLFIAVEAIVEVGIIEMIANAALNLTGGNLALTTMLVLWLSAIASGIVDNIPFTATMIPLIRSLGASGMSTEPLWFSLALGADFGGNYTLVGASANVVVASIAERSGYRITFGLFTRKSLLITTTTLIVASIYVWLRWL
jgi:Na+/H+ antiporter NhaD/arsenite permease-like protein